MAKQFETKIKEEHDKMIEANTRRVRKVDEESEESYGTTAAVRQTQAKQEEKTCYRCNKPGHIIKDCPQKPPENKKACYKCNSTQHLARECKQCTLHPTASHSNEECRDQQADPCTHPAHVGRARHGNKACNLQKMCQIHGNHLQKDCRQQGGNQQYQQGRQQFKNQQYNQRGYQQQQGFQQRFQRFQKPQQGYQQNKSYQPWPPGQQAQQFQQNQQQQNQQQQGAFRQGNNGQQQNNGQKQVAHTNQVQLDQLNLIQQQVTQLVDMANQAIQNDP